jgi:hypothetical protein
MRIIRETYELTAPLFVCLWLQISTMARQVCAVSEQAEKTGVLGGLDYVLLQSLGYAIVQHVALIDQPLGAPAAPPASEPLVAMVVEEEESSTSTGVSASSSLPRSAGKRKLNHQHVGESTPSSISSGPKRKRSVKEETASIPSPSSATTANGGDPAKKCLDCGRTKTNQWRSGPKGMSTYAFPHCP